MTHSPLSHFWKVGLVLGLLALAGEVVAAGGDTGAGEAKAMYCASCHGLAGNPSEAGVPRLAGVSPGGFAAKMKRYRTGSRAGHPLMNILTQGLTDQDVADLGAFYAAQAPK